MKRSTLKDATCAVACLYENLVEPLGLCLLLDLRRQEPEDWGLGMKRRRAAANPEPGTIMASTPGVTSEAHRARHR